MNKPNRYQAGPSRKALYRAVAGAIAGSMIGKFLARPVLGFFQNFAPWVGPAAIAGLVGLTILAALLLPLIFKRKTGDETAQW
ncbi:MAG TPA: hypothetical protein VF793_14730 [Telluria sp.]